MNKRKKKTTQKHQFSRKTIIKGNDSKPTRRTIIFAIIGLGMAITFIIMKACNNPGPGYDHWIGMPLEWIKGF